MDSPNEPDGSIHPLAYGSAGSTSGARRPLVYFGLQLLIGALLAGIAIRFPITTCDLPVKDELRIAARGLGWLGLVIGLQCEVFGIRRRYRPRDMHICMFMGVAAYLFGGVSMQK